MESCWRWTRRSTSMTTHSSATSICRNFMIPQRKTQKRLKHQNFLDVGGGTTTERIKEAFKILLSDANTKVVLVNIFGGIVHCDRVATGIIEAAKQVHLKIPLVVRL